MTKRTFTRHVHARCSAWKEVPTLPYRRSEIAELAKQVVRAQTTLTGGAGEAVARREPGRKERARPLHYRGAVGTLHSEAADRRLSCAARNRGPDDAHGGGGEDSRRAPLAHSLCRW